MTNYAFFLADHAAAAAAAAAMSGSGSVGSGPGTSPLETLNAVAATAGASVGFSAVVDSVTGESSHSKSLTITST